MKKRNKHTPYFYIIISFLGVIAVGTMLLYLPIATKDKEGLSFINALFMTASSVCVTGLSVVKNINETFTLFGKIVIIILVEIGGLSFLTLATFILAILRRKLGMANRFLMKEALNQNTPVGIVKLVKKIILMTLCFQLIGTVINMFVFVPYYDDFFTALGVSAFHAISSFNNAGLDLFGESSMIPFANNVLLNINTCLLIVLGGIGFIVLIDVAKKKRWSRFALHTKIVLSTTVVLLIGGALLFKLAMGKNITWMQAIFTSVTARTAGFTTIDMSAISAPTSLLLIFLMMIGASPCSTGGGLKTTTFFIAFAAIVSFSKGKNPNVFHRKIAQQSITKAFALITLSIIYVIVISFTIACIEKDMSLQEVVFETVSAFGTVGLSMGITTQFSWISKLLLSVTMLCGRLGPLTIISLWNYNWLKNTDDEVKYIEEKIIIG